ncbi:MAG TPA: GNAT family N-acetyltransferase [Verrucomicrobiae bacterium]|nr:GNAT family N-acetyltransferase [Verrucomicrobiae bacterium]
MMRSGQKKAPDAGVISVHMTIRQYRDEDVESVAGLYTDTVRQVNIRDYSPEQVAAWAPQPPDLTRWRKRIAGLSFWVAESENRVIGFCGLGENGYIDFLYVSSSFQRRGIGRQLFEHVAAEARRKGASRLTTNASITARPFFESMGFKVLREQQVEVRGVTLRNYHMEK